MNSNRLEAAPRPLWYLPLLIALAAMLALVPVAGAQQGPSTITLLAPGGPAGAWVQVQWQGAGGAWNVVEGWQGNIDFPPVAGLPFKQWVVFPDQFGNGPFRWVVFAQQGGPVWATSPSFTLPDRPATDVVLTVAGGPAAPTPPAAPAPVLPPATSQVASSELACRVTFCGFSLIMLRVNGAPADAWAGLQWLDPLGGWNDVGGWQGHLTAPVSGPRFQQWVVFPGQYGRGPFRWVIYNEQGGPVWAVSPNFQLPADGIDWRVTITR